MDAHDTDLLRYLPGKNQFRVPLFQRTYCWTPKKNFEPLWNTIISLKGTQKDKTHFFGSFVVMPFGSTSPSSDVHKYLIIDGQQRLTTIMIIL